MSESKTKSSQFWSWVGKAALLFTLIWVLIQLYNHFQTSDYSICARGDYARFILPDSLESELTNLRGFNQIGYIEKLLQNVKDRKNREDAAISIKDHLTNEYPSILNHNFGALRSVWFFEIKNEGKKEVKELQLELPFDGFYKIFPAGETPLDESFDLRIMLSRAKQEEVFSRFSRIVKVASLRPSNIISVMAWGDVPPLEAYAKDSKVTYSEGAYAISYPVKVRAWWGWLYTSNERSGGLLFFYVIAAILILLILVFYVGTHFPKLKINKVDKTTTEERDKTIPNKNQPVPE
jgi:hypothetical protein